MNELSLQVLDHFHQMDIAFEHYTHAAIQSAADRYTLDLAFNACVCKNLLVTTRTESRFFLVMLPVEKSADLKALRDAFGTSRLCFASDETLYRLLGEQSGSVGVSGLLRDRQKRVEVILDVSLRQQQRIAMHPGDNTQTVVISFSDLQRWIQYWGNPLHFFDF